MKRKSGFTIIETILVLAVGGLVLLAIMLTIPTLVRNQRDQERRDDIATLLTKISLYQANNRKALPAIGENKDKLWLPSATTATEWNTFKNRYMPADFNDPNGEQYKVSITTCDNTVGTGNSCNDTLYYKEQTSETQTIEAYFQEPFPNNYIMLIVLNARCFSSEKLISAPGNRTAAVLYRLENGGTFCQNN